MLSVLQLLCVVLGARHPRAATDEISIVILINMVD